jgi:UDP-N-acetylglucosamine--N-acetylmuramyl-(pentapeptide) pyrophosphoryl-undecaprenol N-acetylglucosamine transferase
VSDVLTTPSPFPLRADAGATSDPTPARAMPAPPTHAQGRDPRGNKPDGRDDMTSGTITARPIIIAAGGTGGHFFPAEALAAELIRRGHRIVLMTDARSGGLRSAIFDGREHFILRGAGIAGRGMLRAAKGGLALLIGIAQAQRILRTLHPAVVVGFGGYPAVSPIVAAAFSHPRPRIILHEQNGVLGRANRMLARWCDTLALSLRATTRVAAATRTEHTGNPVRPEIQALIAAPYTPPDSEIRLLVLGGSLGARVFSDIVPAALTALPETLRARLSVTQQCRAEDLERVRGGYGAVGIKAELAAFFPDVAARLGAAHLVIARAGASTVAEIAVAGRPAILVPLPGAIDNHQDANARSLTETGGAWLMPQTHFTPAALAERLGTLLSDPPALARAAQAIRAAARPDAAARLADLIEAHMHQEARS